MTDAEGSEVPDPSSFGEAMAPDRGDHFLVHVDIIAISVPGEASIASPLALVGTEGESVFSFSHLVKPKSDWPLTSVLKTKRVCCGVKPSQYPTLGKRLVEATMVTLLSFDHSGVIKNSISAV